MKTIELSEEQLESLRVCTDYLLENERQSHDEFVQDGESKNHVYFHATVLNNLIP